MNHPRCPHCLKPILIEAPVAKPAPTAWLLKAVGTILLLGGVLLLLFAVWVRVEQLLAAPAIVIQNPLANQPVKPQDDGLDELRKQIADGINMFQQQVKDNEEAARKNPR